MNENERFSTVNQCIKQTQNTQLQFLILNVSLIIINTKIINFVSSQQRSNK